MYMISLHNKKKYKQIILVLLQESGNLGIYAYKIKGRSKIRKEALSEKHSQ